MKKSQIFLYFSCCFISGVAINLFFSVDIFYAWLVFLVSLTALIFNFNNKKIRLLFGGVIFLLAGFLRLELSQPQIKENQIAFYNYSTVEFLGKIVAEPEVRDSHTKLTVGAYQILTGKNKSKKIQGKILVNAPTSRWQYGDKLKIKCNLKTPGIIKATDWRDFDYGKYLSIKNIYSVCYQPEFVKKINTDFDSPSILTKFFVKMFSNKQKFKIIIDKNLPLPEAGLLNAVLLGYRQELSPEIIENFSKVGVSHLLAISGLHISIIAGILFFFFIFLGISRQKAFWPSVLILFFYVLLIGWRASAGRAFIMGTVLLYALKIGRLKNAWHSLFLAAVILLLINPQALLAVGFQLSFLAVLGILYFYQTFNTKWLKFVPDNFKIRAIISVTLSAQIFTLPLVFYYFGIISLVSPLANLLILPVLPLILVAGIILIFAGLVYQPVAFYFGFLIWALLKYVILVVDWLAQIKFGWLKF